MVPVMELVQLLVAVAAPVMAPALEQSMGFVALHTTLAPLVPVSTIPMGQRIGPGSVREPTAAVTQTVPKAKLPFLNAT